MTATLTPPAPPKPAPVFAPAIPTAPGWPPLHQFTVDEYHAMLPAGILPEGGPMELLHGLVVRKSHADPQPGPPIPSLPDWPALHRFSVDDYHAMIRAGIIEEGSRLEFLHGLVVKKMSQNSPHRYATKRLRQRVEGVIPMDQWDFESQAPITVGDSEPEPDGAVVRAAGAALRARNPRASETALVAEVADTSLPHDRGEKKQLHARARIPVYWIVNVIEFIVEVYTNPVGDDYADRRDYGMTEEVPVVLMGTEVGRIRVDAIILPPEPQP